MAGWLDGWRRKRGGLRGEPIPTNTRTTAKYQHIFCSGRGGEGVKGSLALPGTGRENRRPTI
jgi:hypothetical protein